MGKTPQLWVNGKSQHSAARHISALDRGFTLADGLFETMRVHRGTIFRLDQHLSRLANALAALEIPPSPELRQWLLNALHSYGSIDASIRLTVTRGISTGGVAPLDNPQPTVVIAIQPLPLFTSAVYEVGLTAILVSGCRNERAMTAGFKTLAYTEAVAAMIEARRAGAEEGLFLDTEGHCSEAIYSNLFVWNGSTLSTPRITCGALPGITRAVVLEIASKLGISSAERMVWPEELFAAEEAFLTSSLRGLAPLVRINSYPINDGVPGPLTRQIANAYAALVDRECSTINKK